MAILLWSELRMADGNPPGPDDVVVVDSNDTLVFDTAAGSATVGGMVIYGTFEVEDGGPPLELTTEWAVVAGSGTFRVGSEDTPFESAFELTLAGKDNTNDVDLGDYPDGAPGAVAMDMEIQDNNAFLMAMGPGASIEIHADDATKSSWTQLDATAAAGTSQLTLSAATGWQVGDRIGVASTDFDLNQAEEFTITEVSADGLTVTLDTPLAYMHYGEIDRYDDPDGDVHLLDMRAEVFLLSRDVRIQGDVDYDNSVALNAQQDQYGGHTMVMMGGEMHMSGVELAYMGQAGILGRYPAHWHELGDVSGQYIRDSSVHHSFNKGITIHDTQGAEVTSNVVYETISHNYYFEELDTFDNTLTGNLGVNAREPGRFGEVRGASDDNPSNYYTTNANNTLIGNHAAGSEDKGFYFSLTRDDGRDFGTFVDNAAHSTDGRGFYLNHGGLVQDGNPSGSAEQPQKVDPWTVDALTLYKADGVYVRGVEGNFVNSAFAELDSNARFRLNQTIEDSLIVGRTDNVGNPQISAEVTAGRSLPNGDGKLQGFQLYDGPGGLTNVHFDGFQGDDIAIDLSNAIHKTASFAAAGITFGPDVDEASKLDIDGGGNAIGNDGWARGIEDVDGSLTGVPGSMIYQHSRDRDGSEAFNAGEVYEIVEEWGAIITYGQPSGTLRIDNGGTPDENHGSNHGGPADDLSVTRSDGEYATGLRKQIPVFSEYTYQIDYRSIDDQFRLYLHDMDWGQSVIFNLGPVPVTSSLTVDDPYSDASWAAREVSSLEMLEASPDTAVYRSQDGDVLIKLVAEMAHGYLWPQPAGGGNGGLHSGVTVLVDTTAGLDINALVFDDPEPGEGLGPPPVITPFVLGTSGSDDLVGTAHSETIMALESDDTVVSGGGDDMVDGGTGDDSMDGGEGLDTLSFDSQATPGSERDGILFGAIVDLADQGSAQNTGQGNDIFTGFENLEGSDFNDGLFGDDNENTIEGGDGRDFLTGEGGNDTIFGGADFDVVDGGPGADVLYGGTTGGGAIETDIVAYFTATGPLDFVFGTSFSELEPDSTDEIEDDVIGDDIEGVGGASAFSNTFDARSISTTTFFLGGAQSDTFQGGSGTDQLLGLAGDDVMYGNDGQDALIGEGGDDQFWTGGADGFADFIFLDGINEGDDTIHDLELGVDVIQFTGGNVTAIRLEDTTVGGTAATDTLLTYQVNGVDAGTITIIDHDAATVEAQAIISGL